MMNINFCRNTRNRHEKEFRRVARVCKAERVKRAKDEAARQKERAAQLNVAVATLPA